MDFLLNVDGFRASAQAAAASVAAANSAKDIRARAATAGAALLGMIGKEKEKEVCAKICNVIIAIVVSYYCLWL